jgi:hypothetical protein
MLVGFLLRLDGTSDPPNSPQTRESDNHGQDKKLSPSNQADKIRRWAAGKYPPQRL